MDLDQNHTVLLRGRQFGQFGCRRATTHRSGVGRRPFSVTFNCVWQETSPLNPNNCIFLSRLYVYWLRHLVFCTVKQSPFLSITLSSHPFTPIFLFPPQLWLPYLCILVTLPSCLPILPLSPLALNHHPSHPPSSPSHPPLPSPSSSSSSSSSSSHFHSSPTSPLPPTPLNSCIPLCPLRSSCHVPPNPNYHSHPSGPLHKAPHPYSTLGGLHVGWGMFEKNKSRQHRFSLSGS